VGTVIFCIASVLDGQSLESVRTDLEEIDFRDGRATAGWAARPVKNNLQSSGTTASHARITQLVLDKLCASEVLQAAALPRMFSPLLISRYEPGMSYGSHVDDAYMGSPPMRTDLSFTLFLSGPGDYSGGELIIEQPDGDHGFKLEAGSLVLYPSTTLHRVESVSAGTRTVVVGWIQSLCADSRIREILFDLSRVRLALLGHDRSSEALRLLNKCYSNLLRLSSS
jgi:PKHD-type hydroxylase